MPRQPRRARKPSDTKIVPRQLLPDLRAAQALLQIQQGRQYFEVTLQIWRELGHYLVADGSERPYRYKVRAPTFVNLSALPVMLPGCFVADCVAVLGSIDIVLGEVDR